MSFDPANYNLSEIADSADDLLESFNVGDYAQEFYLSAKDIKDIRTCLEFVVFMAEKRERRRDRRKNAVQEQETSGLHAHSPSRNC